MHSRLGWLPLATRAEIGREDRLVAMDDESEYRAKSVVVTDAELVVEMEGGRRYAVPLRLYPILENATPSERANWQLFGGGVGIHWPELDEDIWVCTPTKPGRCGLKPSSGSCGAIACAEGIALRTRHDRGRSELLGE